jgi:hypothetical protein
LQVEDLIAGNFERNAMEAVAHVPHTWGSGWAVRRPAMRAELCAACLCCAAARSSSVLRAR